MFGISFGSKTNKTDSTKDYNQTEVGTQEGTTNNNQLTTGQQNTISAGTSNTQSRNDTSNASTSATTGSTVSQQRGTTQTLSDATLGGLEATVAKLMGDPNLGQIKPISDFNAKDFVDSGMAAATARARTSMDESLGGIFDAIGGRNNSAAALLAQRVGNDSNANLAGAYANLTAQAQGMLRDNLLAGNTVTGTQEAFLTNMLGALRGGKTETTGTAAEQTNQSQQNQATGTNVGAQNTQNQQTQQTNSTEQLIGVLHQLLNTNTNTSGTEHTVGTTKSSGGGLSLGL